MFCKAEFVLRLYSPLSGDLPQLLGATAPILSIQVRGKKQKFGGSTRDPFKSLQRKLAREHQRRHAKVPLVSEERAQIQRIAPVTVTSIGQSLTMRNCMLHIILSLSLSPPPLQVKWWPSTLH